MVSSVPAAQACAVLLDRPEEEGRSALLLHQVCRAKSSDHRKAERTMLQIAALYFGAALLGLWFAASGRKHIWR